MHCIIDYLINIACISKGGILSDCSYDDFNYVLKIGVSAPYMLSKLFMNNFNKNGVIVNISSTRGYMSHQLIQKVIQQQRGELVL